MGNVRISLEKRKRRKNLRSEDVLNGRRTSIFNWGGGKEPHSGEESLREAAGGGDRPSKEPAKCLDEKWATCCGHPRWM